MIDQATDTDVHPLIAERYSPRQFSDVPIEKETLYTLFNAARLAPSSYNEQPWRFIVARKEDNELFQTLAECLYDRNREWAQHAPVLMLSVAAKNVTRNGSLNKYAMHDMGLAMSNLLLQATSMDIRARQMGGFDKNKAQKLLQIPDEYEPVAMAALGYKPEDEELATKPPRSRKAVEEFTYNGVWGKPLFD